LLNLPQTTNRVSSRKTTWVPIGSPLEACKAVARTMIIARPSEASGVSTGRIRKAAGRIRPSAPKTSAIPINRIKPTPYFSTSSPDYWMISASEVVSLVTPIMPKARARATCTTQRAM